MNNEYAAFRCLECGMINVYPRLLSDGSTCMECKGLITPIGDSRVKIYKKQNQSPEIDIEADTAQPEEAIEMTKRLMKCVEYIDRAYPYRREAREHIKHIRKACPLCVQRLNCYGSGGLSQNNDV